MTVPTVGFAGYSGSGKTTLIEQLVRSLKARGLRVAVLKHDVHDFEMDREGKDSWRFSQAGADISLLCSPQKVAFVEQKSRPFPQLLSLIQDVDWILVEGYKSENLAQIGLYRRASGKPLPHPPEHYAAIVTDEDSLRPQVPVFRFEEISEITDFLLKNRPLFTGELP